MRETSVISVVSARPDGATSVAVGLAARLSEQRRVLAVDLALERPEMAPLLNLRETTGVHHLARRARLAGVTPEELAGQIQWRDGVAVLPSTWLPREEWSDVTDQFVDDVLAVAGRQFDHVVVDVGRPRVSLPGSIARGRLLWVVAPSPLGLVAFDRSVTVLAQAGCAWLRQSAVVLNRIPPRVWRTVDRFIEREYGIAVAGRLPLTPALWEAVETAHTLRMLSDPALDAGTDALLARRAFGQLRDAVLASGRHASNRARGE